MVQKRAQGRPLRGEEEVGQQRIVEGARAALRARRTGEVTRKDIAYFAGVTPALVSYYYKSRSELIEAAVKPVLDIYLGRLRSIIRANLPIDEKLQEIIRLLIECHQNDGQIIIAYRELVAPLNRQQGTDLLKIMLYELEGFVAEWLAADHPCAFTASFVKDVIWGICMQVATQPSIQAHRQGELPEPTHVDDTHSGLIVSLLNQSIARPTHVPSRMELRAPPLTPAQVGEAEPFGKTTRASMLVGT